MNERRFIYGAESRLFNVETGGRGQFSMSTATRNPRLMSRPRGRGGVHEAELYA